MKRIGRYAIGRFVATFLGLLILMVLLDLFVVPSLIEVVERIKVLDQALVVRIYLVLPLALLWLSLALGFLHTAPGELRQRLVLADLLFAIAVVMVILAGDHHDFISEESKITYFTSTILLLAGVCALLNYLYNTYVLVSRLTLRLFWALLASAFLFAALDEQLVLHEKIGDLLHRVMRPVGPLEDMGDFVTLVYGFGGLIFVFIFLRFCQKEFLKNDLSFYKIFLGAACLYAASTLLDSFDFLLVPLSKEIDFVYMANAVEEIFEFSAANLFFVAFLVALLESNQHSLLKQATLVVTARAKDRPMLRFTAYAATVIFFMASAMLTVIVRPDQNLIHEGDRFQVEIFADKSHGLSRADGMYYRDGHFANDTASTVAVFGQDRRSVVMGDATAGLKTPGSIVVDKEGTVYVTDDTRNELFAIREGHVQVLLGSSDGLRSPKGLALDPEGNIYISDMKAAAVFRYQDGKLSLFASTLQGLSVPEEMAFDKNHNLYVTEEKQCQVIKVTPEGKASIFADKSSGLGSPEGIAIHGDYVYVSDSKKGAVFRFNLLGEGGPMVSFGKRYRELEGIAVDDRGSIYVASRKKDPVPSIIFKITERSPRDLPPQ